MSAKQTGALSGTSADDSQGRWEDCWAQGRTGFHMDDPNNQLMKFYEQWTVGSKAGSTVMVPLCGKSWDMVALAQKGHKVVGVEWVSKAVAEFWSSIASVSADKVATETVGNHKLSRAVVDSAVKGVTMVQGDFFSIDKAPALPAILGQAGEVDLIWDRAALVAIDPDMREKYSAVEANLLRAGKRMLLVTMEYEKTHEDAAPGPPHSIGVAEVQHLYSDTFEIDHLREVAMTFNLQRFSANHWANMREHVFLLTRK